MNNIRRYTMKKILAIALVVVMLAVTASAIHSPEDTTKVWLNSEEVALSFDTFYLNGVSHMDLGWGQDGGAHEKLSANPVTVGDAETITIRGWAGLKNGTVAEFGYRINEGDPVFSADFARPAEDPVKAAGGDSRMEIVVPVKGLTAPTLITAVVKGEEGEIVDFIEFSVNGQYEAKADDPKPPAENPGTADASVIAVAAVACIALAGVVVAKKVK